MSLGLCGSDFSAETDVGPASVTTLKAGDFPYRSLSCFMNASQRLRYSLFQGMGSISTVPLPGPYWIANGSVFTPSRAHAGVKNPGKIRSWTHFLDDSAAANS